MLQLVNFKAYKTIHCETEWRKIYFIYLYGCFCLGTTLMPGVHRDQKEASDRLKQESQTSMSCHVGAQNQIWLL